MASYKYTDIQFAEAVSASKSIAQVLRKLGLVIAGGNYMTVKTKCQELNLDTSHFTGQGWNKENYKPFKSIKCMTSLKTNLIRQRGRECQSCMLNIWLDKPITLELEHIDGNRFNNSEENLLLLCPNCHSYTPTWRRRK
jgi:hypothetical protein